MSRATPELIVDQLAFPESPRWHEGAFWFSDSYTQRVMRLGPDGRCGAPSTSSRAR